MTVVVVEVVVAIVVTGGWVSVAVVSVMTAAMVVAVFNAGNDDGHLFVAKLMG